jgi:hypothetical protein
MRHRTLPEDILQGGLRDRAIQPFDIPTHVAQPDQAPRNPADLWQALDNRIRPSLTYVVTLALDPAVLTLPLVLTRVTRLVDDRGRQAAESFFIGGRVREHGNPAQGVAGATVLLRETGAEVTTDEQGHFIFTRSPAGPVTLVVRAEGRPEGSRAIDVPAPNYDLEV